MAFSKMAPHAARLPLPWHSLTLQLMGDTGRPSRCEVWDRQFGVWDSQAGMAPWMGGCRGAGGPLAGWLSPALPIMPGWLPIHRTGTQQPPPVWPGRRCAHLPARGQEMPGAAALSLTPEPGAPPRCAS